MGTVEVPAGLGRIFTVEGFDSVMTYVNDVPMVEEIILYRGVDTADVEAGVVNSVDVTLKPVTPMLRIAPRFRHVLPYDTFSLSVQLFDTMYYHGVIAQVSLDATYLYLDSVTRGADLSSTVNFDWGRDDAGGVVTMYANIGSATAPPDGIFDAAKSGEIGRVYYGTYWPRNEVDTLPVSVDLLSWTDTSGQSWQYSGIFRSDGMVTHGYDPYASFEVSGQVMDAQTGQPLAGATVRIQVGEAKGVPAIAGVPDSVLTAADGTYRLSGIPEGFFSVSVEKSGYITLYEYLTVTSSVTLPPFIMSQNLPSGRLRFVLSWDETPTDLDIYLWVQDGNVSYIVYHGSTGDSLTVPYAYLDIDDVDSFGPETITVTNLYRNVMLAVNNYSGEVPLAGCNARVDIYWGTQRYSRFDVPSTGTGDWWYLCDVAPGTTYPSIRYVNTISSTAPGPVPIEVRAKGVHDMATGH